MRVLSVLLALWLNVSAQTSRPNINPPKRQSPTSPSVRADSQSQKSQDPPTTICVGCSLYQEPGKTDQEREDERATNRLYRKYMWATIVGMGGTIIGVIGGLLGLIVIWKQAVASEQAAIAAKDAVELARRSARFEQRAWISPTFDTYQLIDGQPFGVVIHLTNTGKTPARHVSGMVVANKLKIGQEQNFNYDHGTDVFTGTMFPNIPQDIIGYLIPTGIPKEQHIEPIIVTPQLREDLKSGHFYISVYGRITYEDVFGVGHWITFCAPSTGIRFTNPPSCLAYNEVDDLERP